MRQSNVEKPRECVRCGAVIVTTAPGIKAHAVACQAEADIAAILERLRVPFYRRTA